MKLPSINTDNIRWHSGIARPVKELSKRLMHRPHNEAPASTNLFWKGDMWKSVRLFQFVRPEEAGMPRQPAEQSGGAQISHADTTAPGGGPVHPSQRKGTPGPSASNEKVKDATAQDVKGKKKISVPTESLRDASISSSSSRPDQEENRIGAGIRKTKSNKASSNTKTFDSDFAKAAACDRDPAELSWLLICLAEKMTHLPLDARGSRIRGLYDLSERLRSPEQLKVVNDLNYRVFQVSEREINANFHTACDLIRSFPEGEKKEAIGSLKRGLNTAFRISTEDKRYYLDKIEDPLFWWQPQH